MRFVVLLLMLFIVGNSNLYGTVKTDLLCLMEPSSCRHSWSNQCSQNLRDCVVLKNNLNIQKQFNRTNTIYIIRDEIDIDDPKGLNPITIPASCVLKFEGGRISNGVLVGQNTSIDAVPTEIFGEKTTLKGSWTVLSGFPEWFGAKGDGLTDDKLALQKTFDAFLSIKLSSKIYISNKVINVAEGREIIGEKSTLRCLAEGQSQLNVKGSHTFIRGITFENVAKGFPDYGYDNGGKNSTNIVYDCGIEDIKVEECVFKDAICGIYIHSACNDIVINKCKFDGFVSLPDNHLDPLQSCAGGYGICLDADNSDHKDVDNIYRVKITNNSFDNVQRHCLYIQCVFDCLVENNCFNANRDRVHPTPFDAVMMVKNSVDLKVLNNEINNALEAMHLIKVGVLPYNANELRNITIKNNNFHNCGDDRGANGVIGADYGDSIVLANNKFTELRGKLGAIIGLNHNNNVVVRNNYCVVSSKCAWNATIIRYNSSNIKNVTIVENNIDFSNTGKSYDKLLYTDFAADGLIVRDNVTIDGHPNFLISVPNITNKKISNNRNTVSERKGSEAEYLLEKTKNVAFFLPIGLLLGCFFKNMSWWKVLLVGAGLSMALEVLHFWTRRDFIEMDDVICNTLGAVLGFDINLLLRYYQSGRMHVGVL